VRDACKRGFPDEPLEAWSESESGDFLILSNFSILNSQSSLVSWLSGSLVRFWDGRGRTGKIRNRY
jgi:hypothetical protein